MSYNQLFLDRALEEARIGIDLGDGGPFGAVVVKNGTIIATGHNQVIRLNDPTAHAEILAIRKACEVLGVYVLSGCQLYSTCEPCPMCFGAIFWARPDVVYFGALQSHASNAGFDDKKIYNELTVSPALRSIPMHYVQQNVIENLMRDWAQNPNAKMY